MALVLLPSFFIRGQELNTTVNDPVPIPPPNPSHGSYHWSFERLLSVALVPLTVAPFAAGSIHPITDAALGAALVLHSHIGFQYLPPSLSSAPLVNGEVTGLV